ncbi:MerR family transcriptional regulator [Neobacillus sp. Marseille-QA0830]
MEKFISIQQIAKITNLSVHTLRYYEKIGLLAGVDRNESGYRQYSEKDLSWIHFLIRLRETGMSISDMKKFSDLRSQGESSIKERRELLEEHQRKVTAQIEGLQENLKKIVEKIDYYKGMEDPNTSN